MPEEELDIDVEFEDPSPMKSRMEEITEIKAEIELGTMTLDQAIRRLHPDYEDEMIQETLSGRVLI
jgi:hypothetical protein